MPNNLMGDTDDVVMLTIRSRGEPFVGRGGTGPIESQSAEVAWFLIPSNRMIPTSGSPIQLYKLCRRVLLIYPGNSQFTDGSSTPREAWQNYLELQDVSARVVQSGSAMAPSWDFYPNTLGDLTKRENRFGHPGTGNAPFGDFPFQVLPATNTASLLIAFNDPLKPRAGEDVILDNVVAFDVRAYDPGAPVYMDTANSTMSFPGDATYPPGSSTLVSYGAYVDLGYQLPSAYTIAPGAPRHQFSIAQNVRNDPSPLAMTLPTYDTWSLHYENNGVNEDIDSLTDEGTNGLDDPNHPASAGATGNGAVDDPPEYETQPPFPHRLRGLQVKIRVYEPDSRQVREVTVVQDFLPQ
jgi:hypothetical protein